MRQVWGNTRFKKIPKKKKPYSDVVVIFFLSADHSAILGDDFIRSTNTKMLSSLADAVSGTPFDKTTEYSVSSGKEYVRRRD